eukprot:1962002-Ditylum_brightwellii.AAC.1
MSHYGIQAQIEKVYSKIGETFRITHVKGHQNKEEKKEMNRQKREAAKELSWEAQLNIQADKLAMVARRNITPTTQTEMTMYPVGKAHLLIDSTLITWGIKKIVQMAWNLVGLRKDYAHQLGGTKPPSIQ